MLRLKPLVTGHYVFDVPSVAGTVAQHVTFRVAPDWKVAARSPSAVGSSSSAAASLALGR